MRNIVSFKAPQTFQHFGIDWTGEPTTGDERFLVLSVVSRR